MITLEVVALTPMAREWVEGRARRRAERRFRDRRGRAIEIAEMQGEDWDALLAMYRSFDPARRAHGLPPLGEERQAVWADALCRRGPSVVARAGRRVVGHAAMPAASGADEDELIVFVHQEYQAAGIGAALVDALRALARRQAPERAGPLARALRGAARAWRRVEDAVAELPWGALGPSPAGWVPAGPAARGDLMPEAAG